MKVTVTTLIEASDLTDKALDTVHFMRGIGSSKSRGCSLDPKCFDPSSEDEATIQADCPWCATITLLADDSFLIEQPSHDMDPELP